MTIGMRQGTRARAGAPSACAPRASRVLAPLYALLVLLSLCAASSCLTMRTGAAPTGVGPLSFPICHAHADDGGGAPDAPRPHATCPFCSIQCGGFAVLPPTVGTPAPVAVAAAPVGAPVSVLRSGALYPAGASPRGPPPIG